MPLALFNRNQGGTSANTTDQITLPISLTTVGNALCSYSKGNSGVSVTITALNKISYSVFNPNTSGGAGKTAYVVAGW